MPVALGEMEQKSNFTADSDCRNPARAAGSRWPHHPGGRRHDVGHRQDGHGDDGARPGGGVCRRRSLLGRVRRHPCRDARYTPLGAGAGAPRRHGPLQRRRQGCRRRAKPAPRSWVTVQVSRLLKRDPVAGHLVLAGLRPAPEGTGCAEGFIRTPKEKLLWVRTFDPVEDLREALIAFGKTYNQEWLIERHGHRSPAQFRLDQNDSQLAAAGATGSGTAPACSRSVWSSGGSSAPPQRTARYTLHRRSYRCFVRR